MRFFGVFKVVSRTREYKPALFDFIFLKHCMVMNDHIPELRSLSFLSDSSKNDLLLNVKKKLTAEERLKTKIGKLNVKYFIHEADSNGILLPSSTEMKLACEQVASRKKIVDISLIKPEFQNYFK